MKKRYDKLVTVRDAASRMASAALADSTARVRGQEALGRRLESAAAALSPETGFALGGQLAACSELATRMQAAHKATLDRIQIARSDQDDAASARRAARRMLDAAIEARRAHEQAQVLRAQTKAVPLKVKDAGL